ncbi:MAG: hypothetical protein Q9218_005959 [Villophora microphyllina]
MANLDRATEAPYNVIQDMKAWYRVSTVVSYLWDVGSSPPAEDDPLRRQPPDLRYRRDPITARPLVSADAVSLSTSPPPALPA